MNEQRLAVTVVDGQRDRYIPDIFCSVHKAPHGSGAPSSWPVQTIYISWPGPVRAGDHPWVFYDPLSSRRLEKPNVFAFVSVAWEIKKNKKTLLKETGFWIFVIYDKNMLHHKKRLLGLDVFAVGREQDWTEIWTSESFYLSREGWLSMHAFAAVAHFYTHNVPHFHVWKSSSVGSRSSRGLRGPVPCSGALLQT